MLSFGWVQEMGKILKFHCIFCLKKLIIQSELETALNWLQLATVTIL